MQRHRMRWIMLGELCTLNTTYSGLIAIDPGTTKSAYVFLHNKVILSQAKCDNDVFLNWLRGVKKCDGISVVVESIASYGMPVGQEVFETCVWVGRFIEACGKPVRRIKRAEVKNFLCHSSKANDAAIRQRIIDIYGPGKDKAIGIKKQPGPLYGIKADVWQALAVGLTALGLGEEI